MRLHENSTLSYFYISASREILQPWASDWHGVAGISCLKKTLIYVVFWEIFQGILSKTEIWSSSVSTLQYSEMNHIWSHLFLKIEGKVCFIVTVVEKKAAFSTYFQPAIIPLRYEIYIIILPRPRSLLFRLKWIIFTEPRF